MLASQIARRCAEETGAARMSKYSEEVTLIALVNADQDRPAWKKAIRQEFRARHQECGSILLMILIPIIVNLVTAWLAKWIFKEHPTSLAHIQWEAGIALGSLPHTAGIPTCTATHKKQ
jgi:hypothetical protein